MSTDEFAERLAQVRARFIATLPTKILETYAALPTLCGEGASVVAAVGETYRRIHGICGIGATVGFTASGGAAQAVELALLAAYRAGRGLTSAELASFTAALDALRDAAQQELPEITTEG